MDHPDYGDSESRAPRKQRAFTANHAIARLRKMIETRLDWLLSGDPPLDPDDAERLFRDGLARWEQPALPATRARVRDPDPVRFAYDFAKQEIKAWFERVDAQPEWRRWKTAIYTARPFSEVAAFTNRDGDDDGDTTVDTFGYWENVGGRGHGDLDDDDLTVPRLVYSDTDRSWNEFMAAADLRTGHLSAAAQSAWRWAAFIEHCRTSLEPRAASTFDDYLTRPLAEVAAEAGVRVATIHYREQRVLDRVRAEWLDQHGEPLPEALRRRPRVHGLKYRVAFPEQVEEPASVRALSMPGKERTA